MPDIDQLLAIIKDESQPAEARQQALQQLLALEEEAQAHLRKDFQPALASDPAEVDAAWKHLQQRMGRVINLRRWLTVAAAIIVCIGATWLAMPDKTPQAPPVVASTATPVPRFDTIRNTASTTAFHRLPDGTTVHLEANSTLSFRDSFHVDLRGSGLFTVNKASRSFAVFVNGIEVLDLGTVFSITSKANLVKVKLIQGKVLIRSRTVKELALAPGQEFSLNTSTQRYAVNTPSPANIMRETTLNKVLVFKNTSLQEVFNSVEKECGVSIRFKKQEIADKAFTGSFEPGSNARNIIAMVCMINDLNYELRNNTIYIHQ